MAKFGEEPTREAAITDLRSRPTQGRHAASEGVAHRNTIRYPWTPLHDRQLVVEPPAGFTFLLGDVHPPGVRIPQERTAAFENGPTRGLFNAINVNVHHKGGHFVHYEKPEAVVGDVRETFRRARRHPLRNAVCRGRGKTPPGRLVKRFGRRPPRCAVRPALSPASGRRGP